MNTFTPPVLSLPTGEERGVVLTPSSPNIIAHYPVAMNAIAVVIYYVYTPRFSCQPSESEKYSITHAHYGPGVHVYQLRPRHCSRATCQVLIQGDINIAYSTQVASACLNRQPAVVTALNNFHMQVMASRRHLCSITTRTT